MNTIRLTSPRTKFFFLLGKKIQFNQWEIVIELYHEKHEIIILLIWLKNNGDMKIWIIEHQIQLML